MYQGKAGTLPNVVTCNITQVKPVSIFKEFVLKMSCVREKYVLGERGTRCKGL